MMVALAQRETMTSLFRMPKTMSLRKKGLLLSRWDDLKRALRMLGAWARGSYKHVRTRTLLLSLGALLYLVSPIDLIPDFVPILGFVDDATLLFLALAVMRKDLDRFEAWELAPVPERARLS